MNASKKTMSDSAQSSLPQEILIEILSRLPAKSLVRFKCISKFFCSLVVDPVLIDLHQSLSLTLPSRMRILISFRPGTDIATSHYEINYSQEHQGKLQANCVRYLDGDERFQNGRLGRSVNGLISLSMDNGDVAICNLSTRQHVSLQRTCMSSSYKYCRYDSMLLGFDPVSKRYKVLKLGMCDNYEKPLHWIFTLGVDKSWREIKYRYLCPITYSYTSVYVDGVIYSLDTIGSDYGISAFDVEVENFSMISFPEEFLTRYKKPNFFLKSTLVDLDGELGFLHVSKEGLATNMEIWTWKKAMEWEKSTTTLFPLEESQIINQFNSMSFTSNHVGEIVILITKYKRILFYNFRRQVWRNFGISGLRDDLIKGYLTSPAIHISVDNLFNLK